ncbi:MAG TPA: hypothetical protein VF082_04870 [Jiangellaceae bacterium]
MRRAPRAALMIAVVAAVASLAGTALAGPHLSAWSTAQKVDEIDGNSSELNTAFLDGCPIESPDGLSLYMATNRPGGHGLLDIWVARRDTVDSPFGPPENLPAPINSAADDFCPTPVQGEGLFFVSRRTTDESCGLGDIYVARFNRTQGWSEPDHLGCAPDGPNSALDEQGPSYVEVDGQASLYFSSSSATVPGDIYVSRSTLEGFGPAIPVGALNSAGNDIQPNVRKDGREVVFSSNNGYPGHQGGQDVYVSTREAFGDAWSTPVNLGTAVNTSASETRPSLSWDSQTLFFGRAPGPEGMSDVYVATREKLPGSDD